MGVEIERKFLVSGDVPLVGGVEMMQGYLCKDVGRTVRVRLEDEKAVLTIKGETMGLTRLEYEYEIPFEDARELLDMTIDGIVEKTRYYHQSGSHTWEIDVFKRQNEGLVIAEIELTSEDEEFEKPAWVGEEVSFDPRYSNSSLSEKPFKEWV
ncbi:MAG: CYTH domain-containing protein [Akkermansiaceae bacterium]|nr:CYTH domain-containing protein [Akkermansiaceae bacterium]